jgi:FkbM family methyltransferase
MRRIAAGIWRRLRDFAFCLYPTRRRRIHVCGLPTFQFETHGVRDRFISRGILKYGNWEPEVTSLLFRLLQGDADFIDVGANIGWHSIVAAHRLGRRGRVHSFEPERKNLEKLHTNVALSRLGNVVVNGWALSDVAHEGSLSLHRTNLGDHRLGERAHRDAVPVAVRRLDDYTIEMGRPLVIKIDVQGSECRMLKGAEVLLRDRRREVVIICEISPLLLEESGSSLDELIGVLVAGGFDAALVDRLPLRPITWDALRELLNPTALQWTDSGRDIIAFRRPDGMMRELLSP